MENLLINVYGGTLKKICDDLNTQIEDYEMYDISELDGDDKVSLKNLRKLIIKPLTIYIEHMSIVDGKYVELLNRYKV